MSSVALLVTVIEPLTTPSAVVVSNKTDKPSPKDPAAITKGAADEINVALAEAVMAETAMSKLEAVIAKATPARSF